MKVGFGCREFFNHGDATARFVPGTLVDVSENEATFFPGQLMGGTDPEDILFISGLWADPGDLSQSKKKTFVPGQFIEDQFVPGQTVDTGSGVKSFLPGDMVTVGPNKV